MGQTDIIGFVEDTRPSEIDDNKKWLARQEPDTEKKQTETRHNGGKDEIISLPFEQVNDNADELIELRGEGRYFGVTDPEKGTTINAKQSLGPLCDNCHRRGHTRAKCKTVICHKCGVVGDHYETQCPSTMICSRCGQRGHMASTCTSKTRKRQYCRHCDTFNHDDDTCPSIWRSYITKGDGKPSQTLPIIYCYNCGDDTHFGDECHRQRSSRIPNKNGSAFSGTNLPKNLRSVYQQRMASGSRKNQNHHSRNYNGATLPPRPHQYPNKSGFIAANTNLKKNNHGNSNNKSAQINRSGVLPAKRKNGYVKPNRSGFVQKKMNDKGRKNIQVLY